MLLKLDIRLKEIVYYLNGEVKILLKTMVLIFVIFEIYDKKQTNISIGGNNPSTNR